MSEEEGGKWGRKRIEYRFEREENLSIESKEGDARMTI